MCVRACVHVFGFGACNVHTEGCNVCGMHVQCSMYSVACTV